MVAALSGAVLVMLAGLETAAGARAELAAGAAPRMLGLPPEPALAVELVPFAAARVRQRQGQFRIRYYPRLYFRVPNFSRSTSILLMQQGAFSSEWRFTPRLDWTGGVTGAVGQTDYLQLAGLLRSSASAAPAASTSSDAQGRPVGTTTARAGDQNFVTLARADVTSGLRYRLSPLNSVFMRALFNRSQGLGESYAALPITTMGGLEYGHQWRLTRVDELTASVNVSYTDFFRVPGVPERSAWTTFVVGNPTAASAPTVDRVTTSIITGNTAAGSAVPSSQWWLGTGLVEWRRALAPLAEARFRSGISLARRNDSSGWRILPNIGCTLQGPLYRDREHPIIGRLAVSVESTYDSLRGELVPLLRIDGGAMQRLTARWSGGLTVTVTTAATAQPRVWATASGAMSAELPESGGAFSIPVAGQVSQWMLLEFGMRGSVRASHWNSENWRMQDHQLWAYAAITMVKASGPGDPRWAL